jgi:hypothetical protein
MDGYFHKAEQVLHLVKLKMMTTMENTKHAYVSIADSTEPLNLAVNVAQLIIARKSVSIRICDITPADANLPMKSTPSNPLICPFRRDRGVESRDYPI